MEVKDSANKMDKLKKWYKIIDSLTSILQVVGLDGVLTKDKNLGH